MIREHRERIAFVHASIAIVVLSGSLIYCGNALADNKIVFPQDQQIGVIVLTEIAAQHFAADGRT